MKADLTHLGECYGVLEGASAVIHLAAIPGPNLATNEVTFQTNVTTTYNILEAAVGRGIKKAVIASSECTYGICTSKTGLQPTYLPVDEEHPTLPEDPYGLSKICNEQTAAAFHRRSGIQVVAFRIGNVIDAERYKRFPSFIHDSSIRKRLLWSYIDTRDIAEAARLAVEKDDLGFSVLNLAADETSMDIETATLIKEQYPEVSDIRGSIDGFKTLLSNKKAKRSSRLGTCT